MYETMALDSRTIIIKSDNERELSEIVDCISRRDKEKNIKSFLQFASDNRKVINEYKFSREECYDR